MPDIDDVLSPSLARRLREEAAETGHDPATLLETVLARYLEQDGPSDAPAGRAGLSRADLQEELSKNREWLEQTQHLVGAGTWEWHLETGDVRWSDHLYRIFGLHPEAFEPSLESFLEQVHPGDRERVGQLVERQVENGDPIEYRCRIQRPDNGEMRWVDVRARVFGRQDQGPLRYVGIVHDVTDQIRTKRALERQQEHLRKAQRIADVGSFESVPGGGEAYWSDHLYDLFGADPDETTPSLEAFLSVIHPGDRDELVAALEQALDRKESFEYEVRYVPKGTDETRWLRGVSEPTLGDEGTAQRVIGIVQDITELKRARRELQASHRQIELLFELAPLALVVSSGDGIIQEVNVSFERTFGFRAKEVIGKSALEMNIWSDPADRQAVLKSLDENGEVRNHPTTLLTAGGEQREVEVSVTELPRGEAGQYIWAIRDVTERNRYERELERQARFDSVTGLANRYLLMDRLEHAVARADERSDPLTVIFVDFDEFKAVNDEFGHAAGDGLLRAAGERMLTTVREEDTVGRLSGDEFLIILEGMDRDGAEATAQRLLGCFSEPFPVAGTSLPIGVSVGVVVREPETPELRSAEDLIQASDSAMYRVKAGKAQDFYVFGSADKEAQGHRIRRRTRLREAIAEDELTLYYQPILNLPEVSLVGAEALVRWEHPQEGLIPPGEFIPFAEEVGLIWDLDRWVLHEAARQAAEWEDGPLDLDWLSINTTAHRQRNEEFQEEVLDVLEEQGLPGQRLQLEITERLALRSTRPFERLRAAGVRLAIDDFGTGYSSLLYLRHIDAEVLKIDPFFIHDLEMGERTAAIMRSIVGIAEALDIEVIAEGVETNEQHRNLQTIGCDYVQGYLYARPQPPPDLAEWAQSGVDMEASSGVIADQ